MTLAVAHSLAFDPSSHAERSVFMAADSRITFANARHADDGAKEKEKLVKSWFHLGPRLVRGFFCLVAREYSYPAVGV